MDFLSRGFRGVLTAVGLAAASFLSSFAQAQNTPLFQTRDWVEVEPVETVTVVPGERAPLELRFRVRQGFHINSHQPTSEELKPTVVHFSLPIGIVIAQVQYPAGELLSLPIDPTTKWSVYSGEVTIKAQAIAERREMTGPYLIHAELNYQACDNRSCYPPKKLPFE